MGQQGRGRQSTAFTLCAVRLITPRNNDAVESDGPRLIWHLQERAAYPGAAPWAHPDVRGACRQRTGPQSCLGSSTWGTRGRACETRMMSGPVWVPVLVLSLSGWPQTSVFTLWTSVPPPWSYGCWNASGRSGAVPLQGLSADVPPGTWSLLNTLRTWDSTLTLETPYGTELCLARCLPWFHDSK